MNFPFSAIVGQPQLKSALLLCAVDPTLGGVLIRGDKGTAKSTAARALTDILPLIERIVGCAFNCSPGTPCGPCAPSTPLAPGAPLCRAYAPGSPVDGCEVNFKGGQVGAPDYFGSAVAGQLLPV